MNKYKLYNETKSQWEFVIADSEPTVLPDNPSDTLRAGSVILIDEDVNTNPDGIATDVSLINYKALKNNSIDERTGELIVAGHSYGGKVFSMSQNAQINMLGINESRDDITYPLSYSVIDNSETVDLVDATDVHNFYLNALGTKKSYLDSGNTLIDQVNASVDEAGVDAVVDNR